MTIQLPADLTRDIPGGVFAPEDEEAISAAGTLTGQGRAELTVRPRTAEQVAAAVRYARSHRMPMTVRAGGHSIAGLSTADGGLLLDLRPIDGLDVDPASRLVQIGGGACWGDVAQELAPYGLGLTAGDTADVGVGGLTLGGGVGWMVRRHGLAIDNLVGAELVTADGRLLQVSADQHPDLFWAVRGGGGGLGIVTRFDFRAQEVGDVVFGTVTFAREDDVAQLTAWRQAQLDADERLTTTFTLLPGMGEQGAVTQLGVCFAGPERDADPVLSSLHTLGPVLAEDLTLRPYATILESGGPPPGMRVRMHNAFLPELSGPALESVGQVAAQEPTMVSIRSLGGAYSRVDAEATAFAHRSAEVLVTAMRVSPAADDPALASIPGWDAVARFGTGSYPNFSSTPGPQVIAAGYPGATGQRLAQIKAEYDPDRLFGPAHTG